jgi:hypothetical protein
MISTESVVVASQNQVSSDLAGEAVILAVDSGTYYGLDAVGLRIWQLLKEPKSVADIVLTLVTEYDVEPDRCERDVIVLLTKLAEEGLIEVTGAQTS